MSWIAETAAVFVHPNGERRLGRIAIGLPEQTEEHASCAVALDGMDRPLPGPLFGADTMQALMIAVGYARRRVREFVASGGRVLHAGEDEDLDFDPFSSLEI